MRRLGVEAPSVHHLAQALEAELGLPLIDRPVRPLTPTADAAHSIARAGSLLADLRELVRQPRMRALIDFLAQHGQQLSLVRQPPGLGPVRPAQRPEWWRRRVVGGRPRPVAGRRTAEVPPGRP